MSALQGGYQYFCKKCGTARDGLLDLSHNGYDLDGKRPDHMAGYSWNCPKCGSADIDSRAVYFGPVITAPDVPR